MYQKIRELFIFFINNFNYLDKSVISEFVDVMQYYKNIIILSKYKDVDKF